MTGRNTSAYFWWALLFITLMYLGYLYQFDNIEKVIVPGESSHGHYQIELACHLCHDVGAGLKENACESCHAEELERVNDSHPTVKFRDPRNAERIDRIDARYCVTCHKEHRLEVTNDMGVTLPEDYCYYCHQEIGEERPTHKGLPYDSCASAGCHNFHDNTALYERFLAKHLDEPNLKEPALIPGRSSSQDEGEGPLKVEDIDKPENVAFSQEELHEWETTAHAKAGVNCRACHMVTEEGSTEAVWQDYPPFIVCSECHEYETETFLNSHHGMRLAHGFSPMTPEMARQPMKVESHMNELSCASCHQAHDFNTQFASTEACLKCHDDEHSREFKNSKHYQLFEEAQQGGRNAREGVGCVTCHMPRIETRNFGETTVVVNHNPNDFLRPNEKMVRSVCLHCHGLQYTLDSLADPNLIKNNFQGDPSVHVESLEMVRKEMLKQESSKGNK